MKNAVKTCLPLLLIILIAASLAACRSSEKKDIWQNASYLNDTEFGNGAATVQVEVKAENRSVTFTIKTDKKILGDALLEHGLISGDNGVYGLYIKVVNGITADYDVDKSYWAFYKDGEYMLAGVDGTEISDGEHYELVYTR